MLIQEPVQAAVWDCLNHYAYADATFLAERLFAEVTSDDAQYLLATCYYRAGKPFQTYSLLHKRGCQTAECKFLLARCCVDVGKFSEAEVILAGNILTKLKSHEEIETEFGSLSSHVFSLLGAIYSKTERPQKAIDCYKKSLKLNPLLWTAYERLCQLGEKVDPATVFHTPNPNQVNLLLQNTRQPTVVIQQSQPQQPQPPPPVITTESLTPVTEAPSPQPQQGNDTQSTQLLTTPNPPPVASSTPHTPENNIGIHENIMLSVSGAPKTTRKRCIQGLQTNLAKNACNLNPLFSVQDVESEGVIGSQTIATRGCKTGIGKGLLTEQLFMSPLSPSFGILPLETPSPYEAKQNIPFITPSPMALSETNIESKAPKKPATRRAANQTLMPKNPVLNQTGNTRENNSNLNTQNNPPNVRRSSRLFGNSSSVKENNKSQSKSRYTSPKAVGRKSKTRMSKSKQELNEINKGEIILDSKPTVPEVQPQVQIAQMQHQSLVGILALLQSIGKAYQALSQYSCQKAIDYFSALPQHQLNTGWVLCQVGRAYFEMQEHHQAEKTFSEVRRDEPYHIEGMEIYSTALWHLQKEVELSALAQELTEMDKHSPEAWCATGNCFSLQKEHDTAIKFFQRAIQISPNFAYAYTLLGHEYVYTEELDKAMACFRNAIRVDPRHYNAWYGVGLIYYKQEKFSLAEVHFRKALTINPQSSALLCHIGVVQHAQQKSENALVTLNKAIAADPKNPLCKFHRASILFANDRHKEALEELEELKQIIPKESLIYFLIGKVHKKLGNTHLALMNFSWAMDLDPKGINNQIKEAIDKRYVTEEDDSLVHFNEPGEGHAEASGSRSNSSLIDPDEMLQAVESDESL